MSLTNFLAVQDLVVTISAPILIYAIGMMILYICKKNSLKLNLLESIPLSYILGISIITIVTFIGGSLSLFAEASKFLWILGTISLIFLISLSLKYKKHFEIRNIFSADFIILILIYGSLSVVYIAILSSRTIIDSDAAKFYIPMARQLVSSNTLNYSTGYDYNIFLKSIASSLVYGWVYSLSTALVSETFRLLPLAPLLASAILIYLIAKQVTGSKKIALLSFLIFSVLPIQDRFLNFNAFYPDMFYFPFVLYLFYILLCHWYDSKLFGAEKRNLRTDMFYLGIALGITTLFKAQSVFLLVPLFIWIGVKLVNKKILTWLIVCSSIAIPVIMDMASSSITAGMIKIEIHTIGLVYFMILEVIWLFFCFHLLSPDVKKVKAHNRMHLRVVIYFLVPFLLIVMVMFWHEFLLYRGFIWTSSARIPNLDWAAKQLISASSTPQSIPTPVDGLLYYILLMVLVPAGYQYLVIIIVGVLLARRIKLYRILLLISLAYLFALIGRALYVIEETVVFKLNPRDLYPLTPLFSIPLALVINRVSSTSERLNAIDLLLIGYLGLIGYFTSPFLYEWCNFSLITYPIMTKLLSISGMNYEYSLLILPRDRFVFLSSNFLHFLFQSIVCIFPFLLIFGWWSIKLKHLNLTPVIRGIHSIKMRIHSLRYLSIVALLLIIIFPRAEIQINSQYQGSFINAGINHHFGSLSGFIYNYENYNVEGILTFGMPDLLPYYANRIRILDLKNAANLAFLRDILEESNVSKIQHELKRIGVSHLLLPSSDYGMPDTVRFFFNRISAHTYFVSSYGSWIFLSLSEEKFNKSLNKISMTHSFYSCANITFNFRSYFRVLSIEAKPISSENYLTFRLQGLPMISLSKFRTIITKASGNQNVEFTLRLIFTDGSSYDFPYRERPNYLGLLWANIPSSIANKTLRGDALLSIRSIDVQKIEFEFSGIQLVGDTAEILLELPTLTQKTSISLAELQFNTYYTSANTSLTYEIKENNLFISINGPFRTTLDGTLKMFSIPQLNLNDYSYLIVIAKGSPGVMFTMRFYFTDGSSYDFPYKATLTQTPVTFLFPLSAFADKTFRGDAYIGLSYSSGGNAWVEIDDVFLGS